MCESVSGQRREENKKKSSFPFQMKKDNFLIMILAGVLLLVIAWPIGDSKKTSGKAKEQAKGTMGTIYGEENEASWQGGANSETESTKEVQEDGMFLYASYLENALEELLSAMEGAGKVKVMITLKSSKETVLEKDVIKQRQGSTEVDSAGGSRNTTDISEQEETVYTEGDGSSQIPYIKRIDAPKVQGVLVAAEGGQNTKVVKNITEAIQALFGIEAHKIKIVKMNPQ